MSAHSLDDIKKLVFCVSGSSGKERSAQLARLLGEYQRQVSAAPLQPQFNQDFRPPSKGPREIRYGNGEVEVIVTGPRNSASVVQALQYAIRELEEGIVAAGGCISDGTHVQIIRRV